MLSEPRLQEKITEKDQIIAYLKRKYEEDTGNNISVPITWNTFLGKEVEHGSTPVTFDISEINPYDDTQNFHFGNDCFQTQLHKLNLPTVPFGGKGKGQKKKGGTGKINHIQRQKLKDDPMHKVYLLETISLSGFATRGFNKPAFRELVDALENLPCIRTVMLSKNGINDEYFSEIMDLFSNTKVRCIDLSGNSIGKRTGNGIAKKMREEISHIEWIDLCNNPCLEDAGVARGIIQSCRGQFELYHLGVSVGERSLDLLFKSLQSSKDGQISLQSLDLRNSTVSVGCITTLTNVLSPKQALHPQSVNLTALSLSYCFLTPPMCEKLGRALRVSRSIVKLILSNNGLDNQCAKYVLDSLEHNISIAHLDLSVNMLNDWFATRLSRILTLNPVLFTVDLSQNPIGAKGGEDLLRALSEDNDTLASLGNIDLCPLIGCRIREELRQCLLINSLPLEARQEVMQNKMIEKVQITDMDQPTPNLHVWNISYMNIQEQHRLKIKELEYPLLKPIIFTNPGDYDEDERGIWKVNQKIQYDA